MASQNRAGGVVVEWLSIDRVIGTAGLGATLLFGLYEQPTGLALVAGCGWMLALGLSLAHSRARKRHESEVNMERTRGEELEAERDDLLISLEDMQNRWRDADRQRSDLIEMLWSEQRRRVAIEDETEWVPRGRHLQRGNLPKARADEDDEDSA